MVSYLSPGTEIPICGLLFLCVCLSGAGLLHALDEQLCSPPTLSSRLHTAHLNHLMSVCHAYFWVFIVLLLTSDHLIPRHGAFSHADQDMDVVGILMRNQKDEGKLQKAVYTTRNFLFQLQNALAVNCVWTWGLFVFLPLKSDSSLLLYHAYFCFVLSRVRYFSGFWKLVRWNLTLNSDN